MKEELLKFGVTAFQNDKFRIAVPHHEQSGDQLLTEQKADKGVAQLFQDYVMGKLDVNSLGRGGDMESDENELDPLNHFGVSFEEASEVTERGRAATQEVRDALSKRKIKAQSDKIEAEVARRLEEERKKDAERLKATKTE